MDILSVSNVQIAGVVACLPENLIDNAEACKDLYGDGVETLIKATGIKARALANPGTTSLDLGVAAANEVMAKTNTQSDEIGAVLCVTFTPEYNLPSDAPVAQFRLGLPKQCLAFDVNMACSGYGYGLYLGAMLCNQLQKKVLVLDGDVQSSCFSQLDKATMPVMSDIGTATLLEPKKGASEWSFSFYTNGERNEILRIPAGGSKQRVNEQDIAMQEFQDGSKRTNTDIYMDGYAVFMFVATEASKFISEFIGETSSTVDQLDAFIPHQANMYMISQLGRKLKFPKEKIWESGDKFGNPGSGSVPLTIAYNGSKWFQEGKGGNVIISGFGAGMSASVGKISLRPEAYYGLVKYGEK